MTFTPDGRNAYASNSDDVTISAFSVGPLGRLTLLPGAAGTVHTGGTTPLGISVRPDGHTLYVADVDDSTVTAYTIARRLKPRRSSRSSTPPWRTRAGFP